MAENHRGLVKVERTDKRVRVYLSGELIADTTDPLLVWENPHYPAYYLPAADIRAALVPNGKTEHSPSRGTAELLDVQTARGMVAGVARRYLDSPLEELRDAVRLDFAAMDEWLEEDEPIYTHPRNPYTRIDILPSTRTVRVEVDGVILAESRSPRMLLETGLPTRYYLPLADLRRELLRPSETESHCPYKGTARYWSVEIDGQLHEDLIWIYRTPLPESQKIAGLACFYNEKVDTYLDGALRDRPGKR
jgi:uncharacterized protein (DUF427 family)